MNATNDAHKTQIINNNLKHTPEIIRNPYFHLITLLENDEIYGALLKIKDIFELNIKLPLVILLACIDKKINEHDTTTDFNTEFSSLHKELQEFTKQAVSQKFSFGHWEHISGIIKRIPPEHLFSHFQTEELLKVFYEINKLNHTEYTNPKNDKKYKTISAWRNDTIGHGALNCNKEDVKKDILRKLKLLNSILEKNDKFFEAIDIHISNNILTLNHKKTQLKITIDPYIELVNNDQIYIFESYDAKKRISHSINYFEGNKSSLDKLNKSLSKIDLAVHECQNLTDLCFSSSEQLHSTTQYTKNIKRIDDTLNNTFIDGNYFSEWFIKCIDSHPGGIFLCCAERGMGKSAFSRAVNQLNRIKIKSNASLRKLVTKSPEILIRTFNFNSYYNSDYVTFFKVIKDLFSNDICESSINNIIYSSKPIETAYYDVHHAILSEHPNTNDIKSKFLEFLKALFIPWQDVYYKEKLILVLDGIDEIKSGKNYINISDIIPTDAQFKASGLSNVYIFLTSRCQAELTNNLVISDFITQYDFTDSLILTRESNDKVAESKYSRCFIKDIETSFKITDRNLAIELANTLEWRYNYLSAYKKIYEIPNSKSIQEFFIDPFEVYFSYLDSLCKEYSNDIQSLLNLLALTYEPLTIEEISYLLTGDYDANFKLYGQLTDIQNFLLIDKNTTRGTMYKLSHEEWIRKISCNERLKHNRVTLINHLQTFLAKILSTYVIKDFKEPEFDGETWLIANFSKIEYNDFKLLKRILQINFGGKDYQKARKHCFVKNFNNLLSTRYELRPSLSTSLGAILPALTAGATIAASASVAIGSALVLASALPLAPLIVPILSKLRNIRNTHKDPFFTALLKDRVDSSFLDKYYISQCPINNEDFEIHLNNLIECINSSISSDNIMDAYTYTLDLLDTYNYYYENPQCIHILFKGTTSFLKITNNEKLRYMSKKICEKLSAITRNTATKSLYSNSDEKVPKHIKLIRSYAYQSYLYNKCSKIIFSYLPNEAYDLCVKSVNLLCDIDSSLSEKDDLDSKNCYFSNQDLLKKYATYLQNLSDSLQKNST